MSGPDLKKPKPPDMAPKKKRVIMYSIEKTTPEYCPVPKNIPAVPKFKTILADPAWNKYNVSRAAKYRGAIYHYNLMSLERIKAMPVSDLADENAHLYLWCMAGNIDDALEVIKAWGFRYINMFTWNKPKLGIGNYFRTATEHCLFAVRGTAPPKCRNQINWMIDYPNEHSEKPRSFISIVERVSPGPYLELFCRKRPASSERWWVWGNEAGEGEGEGKEGSDIFIPGYPVPKYSWPDNGINNTKKGHHAKPDHSAKTHKGGRHVQ